jgi:hypothetical protein
MKRLKIDLSKKVKEATAEQIKDQQGCEQCPRCGATHPKLFWLELKQPSCVESYYLTAYALCPKTDEPIMYYVQAIEEE